MTKSTELEAAETRKAEAEAEAAIALAEYNRAEARRAHAEAERQELDVEHTRRKLAEELAGDKHHHVYTFSEAVGKTSAEKCINQLASWIRQADGPLDIEIVFNSPGGQVIDGMALFDYIQYVRRRGHKVTTACYGMAASMAGVLLQAGDVRAIGREGYVLIHEVAFGAGGKIGEVEDEVAFAKKIQGRIVKILAERSKLTERQIRSKWRRTDWWLDSAECLELGLVDEVR